MYECIYIYIGEHMNVTPVCVCCILFQYFIMSASGEICNA